MRDLKVLRAKFACEGTADLVILKKASHLDGETLVI